MNITQNHQTGFTLVEAVVSISLLVVAITGPMALSGQSLRTSREARLALEAAHLAEEGVEVIYNIRDNNSADDVGSPPTDWMNGILSECKPVPGSVTGCTVDISNHGGGGVWGNNVLQSCNACESSIPLYVNSASGIYKQKHNGAGGGGWTKSIYTRLVTVEEIVPNHQVRVTSTVAYTGYRGVTHTVVAIGDLYNWFPNIH